MLLHTTMATSQRIVQIFPGVPPTWANVTFYRLRAHTGLSVSAVRKHGHTEWVAVEPAGPVTSVDLLLEVVGDEHWSNQLPKLLCAGTETPTLTRGPRPGLWKLTLTRHTTSVALYPATATSRPALVVEPLAGNEQEFNYWGYNRDMQPLH
eukprot:COSAG01_NODE_855_length_13088_cov_13.421511_13_plen_151_part_00